MDAGPAKSRPRNARRDVVQYQPAVLEPRSTSLRPLPQIRSQARLSAALVMGVALFGACFFHDDPPRQIGCDPQIEGCGEAPTGTGTTTGTSTTTVEPTTGAPADTSRAFRINSLEIVDPHLFLDQMNTCFDMTTAVNEQGLAAQIEMGDFNLLLYFDDITALKPGLKEAESCDLMAGTCIDKTDMSLQVPAELDMVGPCSTLDPAVLQAANVDALNEPLPPCYRTATANISLPIPDAPVPINLREAQFVFNFDDLNDPQAVQNGLIYGFLTQASAEATSLKILGNDLVLWPLMSPSAACEMAYQDQLPAVDMIMDGMTPLTGVWMAVNFTAARVELLPPP